MKSMKRQKKYYLNERYIMALKNDELSSFGNRLMELMQSKECDTPKALAMRLLDEKLVTVNTRGKDIYKNKDNAVGSVEKKVRAHLHAKDGSALQGEFVIAYCKFFGCSADFLFGFTDIKTSDMDIRTICSKTGFSEATISRIIENQLMEEKSHYNEGWSQMLESSLYYGIIDNWLMAGEQALLSAQKEVEREQLQEDLKSASGPDILDVRADIEGVENTIKSTNAAYAGILFNISRNVADFVDHQIQINPKINRFKKMF
jgi:hypothetical protein